MTGDSEEFGQGSARSGGAPGERPTRRSVLGSLGVAASALAGCIDAGRGGSGSEGVEHSRRAFGHEFPYATGQVQLNPWAPSYPHEFYAVLFEAQSVRTPDGDRELGDLLDGVDVDGATVTLSYSDAFSWWNGEPVTARDQWIADRIQSFVSPGAGPTSELVDRYTLRYEFDRPLARPLALSAVAGGVHNTPAWLFAEWAERAEDATTDAAREDLLESLRTHRISLAEAAEKGFGCGPYELSEVSLNRLLLERFEDHPRADEIEVPTLWFPVTQAQTGDDLVAEGWLDGGRGLVGERTGEPPPYLEQLAEYRAASGTKLALDWRNSHLARAGVRRAIACVLPIDDVVENGAWGEPTARQTGLATPAEKRWLDAETRERLHAYPVGTDLDRAIDHMRSAGYEQAGNSEWRGPDGEQPSVRLRTPLWDRWASSGRIVAKALRQFGFAVDFDQIPNRSLFATVRERDYDALLWWSDGDPYSVYDVRSAAPGTIGYGVADPTAEASEHGKPVEVSVPATPGAIDAPAADREPLNLVEAWDRIRAPGDEASTADAVAAIATWWNAALPDVDLSTLVSGVWGNTRDFDWPDDPDRYRAAGPTDRPEFRLLKQGAISPSPGE